MLVNAKLSWQHAVLSALVMSSAVSANYGSIHVRRGEHAVRDILPNQENNLKERDLLSTLSGLLGAAGAGAGNNENAADAAGQQQQAGKNKGQADEAAAGAGEAAAGQNEEAQGDAAQGEAAQGEDAQEADGEAAQGQAKGQGSKSFFDSCCVCSLFGPSSPHQTRDRPVGLSVGNVPLTSYPEAKGAKGEAGSELSQMGLEKRSDADADT